MAKTFDSVIKALKGLSDEEKDILARCLVYNPEDDSLPERVFTEYILMLGDYAERFDEGSLANARRNLPSIVSEGRKDKRWEDHPVFGARLSKKDLKAEIEAIAECSSISLVTTQKCLSACESARQREGKIAMGDFIAAIDTELAGPSKNCDALAFFRSCSDDVANGILHYGDKGMTLDELADELRFECMWVAYEAYVCRP